MFPVAQEPGRGRCSLNSPQVTDARCALSAQIPRLHLPARASKRRAHARGGPLRMRADMHARARARAQPLENSDRRLISWEKKKKPSATPSCEELERGAAPASPSSGDRTRWRHEPLVESVSDVSGLSVSDAHARPNRMRRWHGAGEDGDAFRASPSSVPLKLEFAASLRRALRAWCTDPTPASPGPRLETARASSRRTAAHAR